MLNFRQWLEQDAGMVDSASMNNVAADDAFKRIRSKWMSGNAPDREKLFNPDEKFGKKKKMKHK